MNTLLDRLRDQRKEPASPKTDEFWNRHGLLDNPFPPSRTILPQILYDQQPAVDRFTSIMGEVLGESPVRRVMGIVGQTGAGKTHFLRHCVWEVDTFCRETTRSFVTVEFQAGSGTVHDLVRQAFSAADELCRRYGQIDFLNAIVNAAKEMKQPDTLLAEIRYADLRNVFQYLLKSIEPDFKPRDRGGTYGFETLRDLCRRWLHGGSLTPTERKYLGVFSRISSPSLASRVLTEAFTLARSLGVFEGMILCLDEIETLFTRGLRASQYQSFLQDLRFLYDEALKDGRGYTLAILCASTLRGLEDLRNVNYPAYQRLGFEEQARIQLQPISSFVEAREFAYNYMDYAHGEWTNKSRNRKPKSVTQSLLSDSEIEQAYRNALSSRDPDLFARGDVSQAALLESLHRKAEEKRRSQAQ